MIEIPEGLKDPVDLGFLRNITDQDKEFEKDLLKIFIESSKNDLNKMEESINDVKSNDWYLSSHSFKGSSASIGAFSLARSLEFAQSNKDSCFNEKLKIINEIKQKLEEVITFLKKEI
jgi:HPt (histidine-containing phosphotransfer) domain-containing protein